MRLTSNNSFASASSAARSRCSPWLSGLRSAETANVPFPRPSIRPRDSRMRSASRTDDRPTPKAETSSRSGGSRSPGLNVRELISSVSRSATSSYVFRRSIGSLTVTLSDKRTGNLIAALAARQRTRRGRKRRGRRRPCRRHRRESDSAVTRQRERQADQQRQRDHSGTAEHDAGGEEGARRPRPPPNDHPRERARHEPAEQRHRSDSRSRAARQAVVTKERGDPI